MTEAPPTFRDRIRGFVRLPRERRQKHPQNARRHSDQQRAVLRALLAEVGVVGACLVVPDARGLASLRKAPADEAGFAAWLASYRGRFTFADGHLRDDEIELLPCLVLDLDARELAEVLATYDPIGAQATTDAALLKELFAAAGSSSKPLADLVDSIIAAAAPKPADGGELPEPPAVDPTDELLAKWAALGCVPGSLWEVTSADGLRVHRVLCGDSRKPEDVARLMRGDRAALAEHDPPYGIAIVAHTVGSGEQRDHMGSDGKMRRARVGKFRPVEGDARASTTGGLGTGAFFAEEINGRPKLPSGRRMKARPIEGDAEPGVDVRHLLDSAVRVVIWGANNFAPSLPPSNTWIVWDKKATADGGAVAENSFSDAELAFVSPKTGETGHARIIRHLWSGLCRASEKGSKRLAPTQKPIAVVAKPIEWWTKPGGIVADWYCGSGTVGLAAEALQRVARLMEITPRYVSVTLERMTRAGMVARLVA